MTELTWHPTHHIYNREHHRHYKVMLCDGVAYTQDEWNTESQADYERDKDGYWYFQGDPFKGTIREIK